MLTDFLIEYGTKDQHQRIFAVMFDIFSSVKFDRWIFSLALTSMSKVVFKVSC